MSQKVVQDDVRSSGMAAGPGPNLLSRILDFLFDRFKGLPPSLRAVAYFIFLAFFCATAWRLIAGQYVVRGVVWDGDEPASSCEIRLRGDYFSTNSKGMYYAILSPTQYYRFAFLGEIALPITCKQKDDHFKREKGPLKVTMNVWDDEFGDIYLDGSGAAKSAQPAAGLTSFSLISSAYADEKPASAPKPTDLPQSAPSSVTFPSAGDRLIIERLTFGESAEKMREVEIKIKIGKKRRSLLLQGTRAGELRTKSTVKFGESYYFDIPQDNRGARATIEIEASGLFGNEEAFPLYIPTQYNKPFIVKGSQKSTLILRLAPRAPAS
jgi:hypothetical protein